jgi:hypothetical protein
MDLMVLGLWAWPKARPQDLIHLLNWLNLGSGLRPDPKFNGFNGFGPLGLAQGQAQDLINLINSINLINVGLAPDPKFNQFIKFIKSWGLALGQAQRPKTIKSIKFGVWPTARPQI